MHPVEPNPNTMQKIAIDCAYFEDIIREGYIYVDKTEYLYKIVSNHKYYFLSRPRRFGKSLFINTLKSFFEGKEELFEGLFVSSVNWKWVEYPMILLDFNSIEHATTEDLDRGLRKHLLETALRYAVELHSDTAASLLGELVKKLYNEHHKRVVFLVDEYDKPVISHDDDKSRQIISDNMKFMKTFYDNLKPLEPYLKTVFITGVSKFSKVSIFSTLNNLIELDIEPSFAGIAGYTEDELKQYFMPHLEKLSAKHEMKIKDVHRKIKHNYNGFQFTKENIKVYNPFSIGRALHSLNFDNYWFESATPSFLVNHIKKMNFNVINLENVEISRDKLKVYDTEQLNLIPIMFQTGYLTIKDIEYELIYKLTYPNHEVKSGFCQNLISSFSDGNIDLPIIHRIKKALINKDYQKFVELFRSLFANIANINIPSNIKEKEHFYHTIFYLTMVLAGDDNLQVYSELLTATGRIDMCMETKESVFIIEFKCNQSAAAAIKQAEEKRYADRYLLKEKDIILMGINFDSAKRSIGEALVAIPGSQCKEQYSLVFIQ